MIDVEKARQGCLIKDLIKVELTILNKAGEALGSNTAKMEVDPLTCSLYIADTVTIRVKKSGEMRKIVVRKCGAKHKVVFPVITKDEYEEGKRGLMAFNRYLSAPDHLTLTNLVIGDMAGTKWMR